MPTNNMCMFGWAYLLAKRAFLNPKALLKKILSCLVAFVVEFLGFKKVILLLLGETQNLGFFK